MSNIRHYRINGHSWLGVEFKGVVYLLQYLGGPGELINLGRP